jgi:hypothetical protein
MLVPVNKSNEEVGSTSLAGSAGSAGHVAVPSMLLHVRPCAHVERVRRGVHEAARRSRHRGSGGSTKLEVELGSHHAHPPGGAPRTAGGPSAGARGAPHLSRKVGLKDCNWTGRQDQGFGPLV